MQRTFGTFKFTINIDADSVSIAGIKGWSATYTLADLPDKEEFYRQMIRQVDTRNQGTYKNILRGLVWTRKLLSDG